MNGVLVIDKPAGLTSHDVVARIRRLTGERTGHAGTLDPAATGVLPILIGGATKFSAWISAADKSYEGTIALGIETDTGDTEGVQVAAGDASLLNASRVSASAKSLIGSIDQIPPAFSAIKVDGKKAYKEARMGKELDLSPRRVRVDEFKITGFRPGRLAEADFEISCSKGTYVRSLARDLGQALACGGHLKTLRRTAAGSFRIKDAIDLTAAEKLQAEGLLAGRLVSTADALTDLPKGVVGSSHLKSALNGRTLPALALKQRPATSPDSENKEVAVLDESGRLVGVYRRTNEDYEPLRIAAEAGR